VSRRAFSIALLEGKRVVSLKRYLADTIGTRKGDKKRVKTLLSILIKVLVQPASHNCPSTRLRTLGPVQDKGVIVLFPIAELFLAKEASHVVPVVPGRCEVETSFGQGRRVGDEGAGMWPFN
jgi:hypothetical protein